MKSDTTTSLKMARHPLSFAAIIFLYGIFNLAWPTCPKLGYWVAPGHSLIADHAAMFEDAANQDVVLLGEVHAQPSDHRWELYVATALHSRNPNLVLAFEMFPRSVQNALDAWVDGDLDLDAFLHEARWNEVWGYPADHYMPLFNFARDNVIPMIAANVERELVRQVSADGWSSISQQDRKGIGDPAPALPLYTRFLAEIFAMKRKLVPHARTEQHGEPSLEMSSSESDIEIAMADPDFAKFVDAQLLWDRAMAEAISSARSTPQPPLVVTIAGRTHVQHGWGIRHQLADLGISDVVSFVTIDIDDPSRSSTANGCALLADGLAEAGYAVRYSDSEEDTQPPRLGVEFETVDGGVSVLRVLPGSVAAAAGLLAGDLVLEAAGHPIRDVPGLISIIQETAPGTWLPLQIWRDGTTSLVVARFPTVQRETPSP